MTKSERIILVCTAVATAAILLFPPLLLNNDDGVPELHYYFLFALPKFHIWIGWWPVLLLIMVSEWLPIALLAFISYRIAHSRKKQVLEAGLWNGQPAYNPGVWPPPPPPPAAQQCDAPDADAGIRVSLVESRLWHRHG